MWILIVLIIIIAAIVVFFKLPYSKTASEFNKSVAGRVSATAKSTDFFSENDLINLPLPVQKYFRHCGYLGKPKMSYMRAAFKDVDFEMSPGKVIKIDYVQYNFVETPDRFALISSSLFGIPFEGLDSFLNGAGSMKGTLAKIITLFDQRGEEMDKSSLVTVLAECLLNPNIALQSYIQWEAVDDTHAKATITWKGISASGVFTFDEDGKLLSVRTSDRTATDVNGNSRQADWSAICSGYENTNGLLQPTILQSVWHYPEGDSVYFNENKAAVKIEYFY